MPYGSAESACQDVLAWSSCPVPCRRIEDHTAYIARAYDRKGNVLCSGDVCVELSMSLTLGEIVMDTLPADFRTRKFYILG